MKIGIVTPAPPRSRYGNRVTALRWARILKSLGHRVEVRQAYDGERYDLLVALHARRSHDSINRFHREHPDKPLIVALTGTDLYRDLPTNRQAQRSLELATRLVVLQPAAIDTLPDLHRTKARVIHQSVTLPPSVRRDRKRSDSRDAGGNFDVCVIGHLRPVKDPFRAALASRLLPEYSRLRIIQIGRAMSNEMEKRARDEMTKNPRYKWLGELSPGRTMSILARSQVCVLSSKMEGGANVLSEAIALGVPIVSSCIPGSMGILGIRYAGYFNVGDTKELARVLYWAEQYPDFLARLRSKCKALEHLFVPERERKAWRELLSEFEQPGSVS